MSLQLMLPLSDSAIGSGESERGLTPCDKQGGPTTDPLGPEAAHANLSARQAQEVGLLTSGTCGPTGFGSLASHDLALFLASRLVPVVASLGSTLFTLTWKQRVTPSGRSIYALRARARRTSANGYSSWPTPNAGPQNDTDTKWEQRRKECKERWGNNGFGLTLGMATQLVAWPTPRAEDRQASKIEIANLDPRKRIETAANLVIGNLANGSPVGMEKPGRLNPEFSRWLMGLPPEWDECAVMATQS